MLRGLFLAARVLTFASNPARDAAPALLPVAIEPGPTLTSPLLRAWSCVDRGAAPCTLEQVAAADANGDFTTAPHLVPDALPDAAAEASAYFHAARARTFFEALAGQSLPNPVDVVAGFRDGGVPSADSFYLRAGSAPAFERTYGTTRGTVWLGRGAIRDTAYDGDVVLHEMTHAMLDGTLHARGFRRTPYGASVEPEALSEAVADYFAAAMSDDPVLGEWTSGESGASSALRSLEDLVACPASTNGFSHDESLLFSGALWSARQALDAGERTAFDTSVYAAIARAPAQAEIGFSDVAALLPASVSTELSRRGYGCTPLFDGNTPLRAARGAYFAPGTDALGGGDVAPGILQLRVDLPPGATRLAVEFEAIAISHAHAEEARTPFAPAVVAAWDTPLRWEGTTSNGVIADASGPSIARAELAIPAGARVAYLQIVNRGQSDGAYDYVTTRVTSETPLGAPEPLYEARGSGCAMSTRRSPDPRSETTFGFLLAGGLLMSVIARRNKAGTGYRNRR